MCSKLSLKQENILLSVFYSHKTHWHTYFKVKRLKIELRTFKAFQPVRYIFYSFLKAYCLGECISMLSYFPWASCDECGETVLSTAQLIRHRFDVHDVDKITCTDCKGIYTSYGSWRYHRRSCNSHNNTQTTENSNDDTAETTEVDSTAQSPSAETGMGFLYNRICDGIFSIIFHWNYLI